LEKGIGKFRVAQQNDRFAGIPLFRPARFGLSARVAMASAASAVAVTILVASVLLLLAERGMKLDAVIELRVNESALLERVETRVGQMRERGEEIRVDDTPEVLTKRLASYRALTEPLIHYYSERRKLLTVDGMMKIEAVTREIDRILSAIGAVEAKAAKKASAAKRTAMAGRKAANKTAETGAEKGAKPAARKASKSAGKGARKAAKVSRKGAKKGPKTAKTAARRAKKGAKKTARKAAAGSRPRIAAKAGKAAKKAAKKVTKRRAKA